MRPGEHHPQRTDRAVRLALGAATERPADGLEAVPGVLHVERLDGKVRFDVDTDHLDDAMDHLAPLRIRSLVSHPPTLEELFLRQFGEQVDEPVEEGARP